MANWAFTDYVVEGPHETLAKIYEAIKNPDTSEGDEGWEGGVLKALGITWEERTPDGKGLYMRGFIQEEPSLGENTLEFYAQEAWGATDFNEALEGAFPDIKVFYKVGEEGGEVYATNDKEGKYFSERFYVDTAIDDEYDSEYFKDEESMWQWLTQRFQQKIHSMKDVEKWNEKHEELCDDDENFINIYKFAIID